MIYLAQLLCPKRHAILALLIEELATEAETITCGRELMATAMDAAVTGDAPGCPKVNPWCGICGARRETWSIEVAKTKFRTMDDAKKEGKEMEKENLRSRRQMDALGLTFDSPARKN